MNDQRKIVLEEKRHVSSKVSDLCRYIGFGVVAVVWAMLTSSSQFSINVTRNYEIALSFSAVCGIVTIFFDYLQFLAGYISVNEALANENNKYNKSSLAYHSRTFFFWAKQATAVFGILILIGVIFANL